MVMKSRISNSYPTRFGYPCPTPPPHEFELDVVVAVKTAYLACFGPARTGWGLHWLELSPGEK